MRNRGKEPRRQLRKGAARLRIGNVERACNPRFGPGNDGDRARLNRGGDEILTIDRRALKRAEHRAGGNLAVIDRKAGDADVARPARRKSRALHQVGQPHQCLSTR